ncbi:MAG: NADH:flavin oxidoreductase, partial [Acidobacteriota bacterium]
ADEAVEALRLFEQAGLQLVNVTAGCPYYNPHVGRPADREPPDGYGAPESGFTGVARHFALAEAAHRACPGVAVVGTGYSYLRHYALEAGEANLRDDRVTLVGLGRGAIAYPDFARDVTMEKKKACYTVSYCTTLMRSKGNELGQYATGCVPRDPVYAKLLQEIQKEAKRTAAGAAAPADVANQGEAK